MQTDTLFIVGVQRSGTTLLASLLNNHPDITVAQKATGFRIVTAINNMYDVWPHNLQFEKEVILKWLIENDVNDRLRELLDLENFANYTTIQELLAGSIQKKLVSNGKQLWVDKAPNLQHYVNDVALLMPRAKFLHIVRDGRANADSMSRRSYRHLKLSAQHWLDGNVQGVVNQQIMGSDHYLIIRYEDLLAQPEATLRTVCDFVGVDFKVAMLTPDSKDVPEEQQYVKSFLDTSKIDSWRKKRSAKEIEQMETIQGGLLHTFGYTLNHPALAKSAKPLRLRSRIYYNQADSFRALFRRKRMGMIDKENVELDLSFRSRLIAFGTQFVSDFLSRPIYKSLFSRYFYRSKYYRP